MKLNARVRATVIALGLLVPLSHAAAQQASGSSGYPLDEQRREPFRIFDNLYYVGADYVSSFLLTTSDGLILIDTLFADEGYPQYLLDNVRAVGFDPADIEYILITHGHRDHFGGAAQVQAATGARVAAAAEDWELIRAEQGDAAPSRDLTFGDGDTLTLGDTTLRFYITPGHTPGVLSMEFPVFDGDREHKAFSHSGAGVMTEEPEVLRTFIESTEKVIAVEGVEVNITNHPFLWDIFGRAERLASRAPGEPHPFVTPGEFYTWLEGILADARERLAAATGQATE